MHVGSNARQVISRSFKILKNPEYIVNMNRMHFTRIVESTTHLKKYSKNGNMRILTFIIDLLSIESICFFGTKIIGSIKRLILPFHMYNTFIVYFTSALISTNLYFLFVLCYIAFYENAGKSYAMQGMCLKCRGVFVSECNG